MDVTSVKSYPSGVFNVFDDCKQPIFCLLAFVFAILPLQSDSSKSHLYTTVPYSIKAVLAHVPFGVFEQEHFKYNMIHF